MGENKFIKVHVGFFSAILKTSRQDNASCGQNIHTSKKGEKLEKITILQWTNLRLWLALVSEKQVVEAMD